jgi:hypothetical protein
MHGVRAKRAHPKFGEGVIVNIEGSSQARAHIILVNSV